jgi:hypothetical protein
MTPVATVVLTAALGLAAASSAMAQGTFSPRQQAPAATTPSREDPAAAQVGDALPLPPAVRDLRNQLPPDPRGTARQLGLREPTGRATDMRNRTPTPREIADALAPR